MTDSFADKIREYLADKEIIREGLWHEGPALIRALQDRGGFGACSVRQIARESGYSATYLCRVARGQLIMAPRCYVKLAEMLEMIT